MQDELVHRSKQWTYIGIAFAATLPAFGVRAGVFGSSHAPGGVETLLFGVGILGAAFWLSWGAEVAQLDISQGLAIAFLAFIAVLPEYAVDLYFSWTSGRQDAGHLVDCGSPHCRQLAIANMTGANRLLIGLGWAAVVLIWYLRSKKKHVEVPNDRRTDVGMLIIATLWAFTIVIRGSLSLIDSVVLVSMFVLYLWHAVKEESEEPELIGPPLAIAALPKGARRSVVIGMFVYAAAIILASAEPFAHGLVSTARSAGLNEFLAVQWLAPLASEAPEMIIAILFVLRAKPEAGLGALVSSKVNQWTLLVGTVPLVYGLAYGSVTHPMRLDGRQVEEVLLTAAQSLFACAVLANMSISRGEAIGLLVLFLAQFGFESQTVRYGFAAAYTVGTVAIFVAGKGARAGLRASVKRALSKPGTT
jgi:cation:H+ antiporter